MKRAVIIGFATWAAFAIAYYALLHGHMRYAIPVAGRGAL
jgi:hypothetical protein